MLELKITFFYPYAPSVMQYKLNKVTKVFFSKIVVGKKIAFNHNKFNNSCVRVHTNGK